MIKLFEKYKNYKEHNIFMRKLYYFLNQIDKEGDYKFSIEKNPDEDLLYTIYISLPKLKTLDSIKNVLYADIYPDLLTINYGSYNDKKGKYNSIINYLKEKIKLRYDDAFADVCFYFEKDTPPETNFDVEEYKLFKDKEKFGL